jgi:hypothetical protein
VQAAADTASTDTALAAASVAQAATDAAVHVAVMVAAFDLACERETAEVAEARRDVTLEAARHVADRNDLMAALRVPSAKTWGFVGNPEPGGTEVQLEHDPPRPIESVKWTMSA